MQITRRHFIAATAAAAIVPARGWATTFLSIGDIRIDTLSDGNLPLPASFALGDIPREQADPILKKYGITSDQFDRPCNVTLLRDGTNTVLFDVGAGSDFIPTTGKLMDAFDVLGITPEDVTHVVLTHGHPDHLGGLLDDFDDPMFYDAKHMIGKQEFDYWLDPDTVNTIVAERTTMAVGAKRRLETVESSITTFDDGDEILPGVAAQATYGHTPGHMSFEVRAGSESVLITGDAVVDHHLAFERPEWHSGADQDPDTAVVSRTRLLDRLATEQMTLVGFHLPGGGIGRTERTGDGYRFVAAEG